MVWFGKFTDIASLVLLLGFPQPKVRSTFQDGRSHACRPEVTLACYVLDLRSKFFLLINM